MNSRLVQRSQRQNQWESGADLGVWFSLFAIWRDKRKVCGGETEDHAQSRVGPIWTLRNDAVR